MSRRAGFRIYVDNWCPNAIIIGRRRRHLALHYRDWLWLRGLVIRPRRIWPHGGVDKINSGADYENLGISKKATSASWQWTEWRGPNRKPENRRQFSFKKYLRVGTSDWCLVLILHPGMQWALCLDWWREKSNFICLGFCPDKGRKLKTHYCMMTRFHGG